MNFRSRIEYRSINENFKPGRGIFRITLAGDNIGIFEGISKGILD